MGADHENKCEGFGGLGSDRTAKCSVLPLNIAIPSSRGSLDILPVNPQLIT